MASWLTFILYSALWTFVRLLPERVAYSLFDAMAKFAYRRNGKRVQRLRYNYEIVIPHSPASERESLVQAGLSSAMRYWCDTFRISDWSKEKTLASTRTNNEEFLFEPLRENRGVIVAVPHAGNWDHAGAYFCASGARVNTVAEHLKPERLFRKFLAHRERMGMRVLDLNAGVLDDLRRILREERELVALVADRDLSRSGIDVRFFDKVARMPAGPAILAYDTEADLITAFVAYREQGIEVFFTPPIKVNRDAERSAEIVRLTQVMASRFEDAIRKDPTSWHMQQRIFIDETFVERS